MSRLRRHSASRREAFRNFRLDRITHSAASGEVFAEVEGRRLDAYLKAVGVGQRDVI